MKLTGENRKTRGKTCPNATLSTTNPTWTDPESNRRLTAWAMARTCPSATLSTTNPTWIDPGSNPGLRGGRPAANRLSHGTALGWGLPCQRSSSGSLSVYVEDFKNFLHVLFCARLWWVAINAHKFQAKYSPCLNRKPTEKSVLFT
jgi:hypothetical protein